MGRYLKNTELQSGGYAIRLPVGTNSIGPDSPVDGLVRFNEEESKIEFYYGGLWNRIAKIGRVEIDKDEFITADGVTSYGPMKYSYHVTQESHVMVFVGGVHQKAGINYTFNNPGDSYINIDPSTGGTAGQPIIIIHNLNSTDAA
jgi:hypothetical protein